MPDDVEEGILKGLYLFRRRGKMAHHAVVWQRVHHAVRAGRRAAEKFSVFPISGRPKLSAVAAGRSFGRPVEPPIPNRIPERPTLPGAGRRRAPLLKTLSGFYPAGLRSATLFLVQTAMAGRHAGALRRFFEVDPKASPSPQSMPWRRRVRLRFLKWTARFASLVLIPKT